MTDLILVIWFDYDNDNVSNDIERCNSRYFTISSLCRELSLTCMLRLLGCSCVQITCKTLGAYHMQHDMCHTVQRDSSAIKVDRAAITSILALFYWLKPLTDEGSVK